MTMANRVLVPVVVGLVTGFAPPLASAQAAPPLHRAAAMGYTQTVAQLLDEGADVNGEDDHGATPLHVAALYGQIHVVELLLTAGAEVDASEADQRPFPLGGNFVMGAVGKGFTPLHWAVAGGHRDVVELLLANGANVNGGHTAYTPLEDAVLLGNIAVAELLLAEGADLTVERNDGKTLLDLAKTDRMRDLLRRYGAK